MESVDWGSDFEITDGTNKITYKNKRLSLHLLDESKVRKIGVIQGTKSGKLVYRKRNLVEDNHVMRKNDSWGLNWAVIQLLPDDAYILIQSDKCDYYTTVGDAKCSGEFLWFKSVGFEKQFFVPRKNFKRREL